ncbi:MAG: hypothetical protein ACOH1J_08145 [Microbacteriaceae bacterium]
MSKSSVVSKLSCAAESHLPESDAITIAEVRAFGGASARTQLEVLTELRNRAENPASSTLTAFVGSLIVVFVAVIAPQFAAFPKAEVLDYIPLGAMLLVVGAVMLKIHLDLGQVAQPRRIAAVRLAAYEDEITRRRSESGGRGRRWRRTH